MPVFDVYFLISEILMKFRFLDFVRGYKISVGGNLKVEESFLRIG